MVYSKNHIRFLLNIFSVRELALELSKIGRRKYRRFRSVSKSAVAEWIGDVKPRREHRLLILELYQRCRDSISTLNEDFNTKKRDSRESLNLF